MSGDHWTLANVVQQEAACAVCILRHTWGESFLAYKGCGLVSQTSCDRKASQDSGSERTVRCCIRRTGDFRKVKLFSVQTEEVEQGIIVLQSFQIHKHRARCIRWI